MTTAITGHCSRCGKIWTLNEGRGVCQWCGKPATAQNSTTKPRSIKSSSRRRQKQVDGNGKGYDQLTGVYATYYKVASRFAHKAMVDDREDLLHDTMLTLAVAERNNGHKPFTEAVMCRIASRCLADYWRSHYEITNGLDCGHCSKAQRQECKEDWLYGDCPKAIKLDYLSKPVIGEDGELTELGELIADDKALDLDAWVSESTWELSYKPRLVDIAHKLKAGMPLNNADLLYLSRYRRREQKRLFD